ncbi:hypothetical protein CDA63_08995 [Hymenobacter amundsenii]|uniref:Uncharacterized protein n=1 Tax=Hymenobacter amundsenii TaxID=2006685 RepID=A0A246FLA4_9BACT|nr:hypothetical protein [Hymenobacter amundsenii]OWP63502.1 hypothetical protein CDA63_08995 [Hymenobacter amundsenii]
MMTPYIEEFNRRVQEAAAFDKQMIDRFGTSDSLAWRDDTIEAQEPGNPALHSADPRWLSPKPYSSRYLFVFVSIVGSPALPLTALTCAMESMLTGDQIDVDYVRALLGQMEEAGLMEDDAVILMNGEGLTPERRKGATDTGKLKEEQVHHTVFEGGTHYRVRARLIEKWLERKERELIPIVVTPDLQQPKPLVPCQLVGHLIKEILLKVEGGSKSLDLLAAHMGFSSPYEDFKRNKNPSSNMLAMVFALKKKNLLTAGDMKAAFIGIACRYGYKYNRLYDPKGNPTYRRAEEKAVSLLESWRFR